MGSEGRGWHGAAAAGTDEGVGGRAEKPTTTTTAVVAAGAPADVPTSAASVDITLPLPEMTPHIMQVPWPSAAPSSPVFFLICPSVLAPGVGGCFFFLFALMRR
jgi:hypothetical protein